MINVYLKYPWAFPDSSYYKNMVNYPPEGINYINSNQYGVISSKKSFSFSNGLKKTIRNTLNFTGISIPNVHYSNPKNADIIHGAHSLVYTAKPWVFDIEAGWNFWINGRPNYFSNKFIRHIISKDNCKKIMPWTNHCREEILKVFPEFDSKIEVVYPAVPFFENISIKKSNTTLLFVSRYFHMKGGLYVFEIFKQLKKEYKDLRLIVVSEVPSEVVAKYKDVKDIQILPMMPQKDLFEKIYPISDIFIYPSFVDTFGFAILEAMSFGLPIVALDDIVRREIIDDGSTGFLINRYSNDYMSIDKKIVKDFVNKTSYLIDDYNTTKTMSTNSINITKNGKFSIEQRNYSLKKIYEGYL